MKVTLNCANEECSFTTTSKQLLQKHQSAKHPELRMARGRPVKSEKKSRTEINKDYRANAAKKKLQRKAVIERLCRSWRLRELRHAAAQWKRVADQPLELAPRDAILMKLDGLPYPGRMPPCYRSQPSPKWWNKTGYPQPPRPVCFASGGAQYRIARASAYRDKCPKTAMSLARMRHIKLCKAGVYSGDETPSDAYWAGDKQKISLLKIYKEEDAMLSFSSVEETRWPEEALPPS